MKICFIQHRAYELFNPSVKTQFGGAEVHMYLHARALAKNPDHEITFIVADYKQPDMEVYDNIQVLKSSDFNVSILKQAIAFYKVFKSVDADIYLQMSLTRFSFVMALICLLKKKKFVYLLSHDKDLNGEILKSNYIFQKISLLVFLFSTKIIAQNKYQYDMLKKYHIRSLIIKSSLDAETIKQEKKEYHLWMARAENWKKPELFIELAGKNPLEKFMMVCPPFTEVDIKYFRQLKDSCMALNNLIFIDDYIPFQELDSYFRKAKLFINTSESEGFPTTFLHACKNGVPILSLSVNPDSILDEHSIGFYCHGNEKELQQNFILMNNDEQLYHQFSQNSLQYFKDYHNLKENSKKLYDYISN